LPFPAEGTKASHQREENVPSGLSCTPADEYLRQNSSSSYSYLNRVERGTTLTHV